MIFGYARISTTKETQKTDRQLLTLKKYSEENNFEFEEIIEEKYSGKTMDRPLYNDLRKRLRKEDVLVITDLDRLGRNADAVIMELKELKSKGVKVIALDVPYMNEWEKVNNDSIYDMIIDIVITLKAHMAQQEREKLVSRINQGLDVARENGSKLGRPPVELTKDFIKEYEKFKNGDYGKISATKFAKMLGMGRSTLYKYIQIYKGE